MCICSVLEVQTVCFSVFELLLIARNFSFFMPNEDMETERRLGAIRPPVSPWFFFPAYKIIQLTRMRIESGDCLGKKDTKIGD